MPHKPARLLAATLSVVLASSLFAACGSDTDVDATDAETTVAEASADETSADETTVGDATDADEEAEAAGEVTIEHYSGIDTVPVNPETVVVVDVGIALTLDALGVDWDGLASLGGSVPEEFASVLENPDVASVGTSFEPDYEAINALEPDLIIVASRSSATYPDMSEIAPTVDLTFGEGVPFFEALETQLDQIGQIFQVEDEAAAAFAEVQAEADAISEQAPAAGTALVLMSNAGEVSAYGPGSRFGIVHDLGFAAADDSLERDATHGDVVSFEFIHEAAPDTMFVIDRSAAIGEEGEAAAQVLDNELVADTPAWQNDRVLYVDSYAWYIVSSSLPGATRILADIDAGLG